MTRTAIRNVLVFDGEALLSGPRTVVLDGAQISSISRSDGAAAPEAEIDIDIDIDGTGCTILPGLIDTHVHIRDTAQLASCTRYGVTTVCDMACMPPSKYAQLRAASGPTTWLGTSLPAYAADSRHGKLFRYFAGVGPEHALEQAEQADGFVRARVDEGVDYVKIIADEPGIAQEALDAVQVAAKKQGVMTIAHTAQYGAFARGLHAGFDVLTHVPMDRPLDGKITDRMVEQGTVAVPTLSMMGAFKKSWLMWPLFYNKDFAHALASVKAMREAGVPILAGTDANDSGVVTVMAGSALHGELELLVRAGLSELEALTAATAGPARWFPGLGDRGRVREWLRADLVLVDENPVEDITVTRRVRRVWSKGVEVEVAGAEEGEGGGWCVMM